MARDLKLKVLTVGNGGVKVSWTDITSKADWGIAGNTAFGVAVLVGFLAMVPAAMSGGAILILVWLGVVVGVPVMMRLPEEKSNSVTFGATETTLHDGTVVPTSDISRIEFGSEMQLTGSKTKTAFAMEQDDPQTLIRLWVHDNYTQNISLNRWQNQVNHEIRDTLAKALDQVRKTEANDQRQEIQGTAGEYGLPDY